MGSIIEHEMVKDTYEVTDVFIGKGLEKTMLVLSLISLLRMFVLVKLFLVLPQKLILNLFNLL